MVAVDWPAVAWFGRSEAEKLVAFCCCTVPARSFGLISGDYKTLLRRGLAGVRSWCFRESLGRDHVAGGSNGWLDEGHQVDD